MTTTPDAPDAVDASEDRTLWIALRQTLVAEWRDDYSVVSIVDELAATAERILAARVSAAATRAADDRAERIAQAIYAETRDGRIAAWQHTAARIARTTP